MLNSSVVYVDVQRDLFYLKLATVRTLRNYEPNKHTNNQPNWVNHRSPSSGETCLTVNSVTLEVYRMLHPKEVKERAPFSVK